MLRGYFSHKILGIYNGHTNIKKILMGSVADQCIMNNIRAQGLILKRDVCKEFWDTIIIK